MEPTPIATPEELHQKLEEAEAEFRSVKEQEEFFRAKAEELRNLRNQLIGRASALRELLGPPPGSPEAPPAPDA